MTETATVASEVNYLLARVAPAELDVLRQHWQPITVGSGDDLIRPGSEIRYAYFPETFIASVIALPDDERVEAVSVGREGFVGYQSALLHGRTLSETVVQIEGEGYRILVSDLERLVLELPSLRNELERYVLTVVEETSINAACHRSHNLDQRAARWLLHMHDRVDTPVFKMTHKYLASMLGVRRAGVTIALGKLQQCRMVSYSRGRISVLDRAAMTRTACKCYTLVKDLQRHGLPRA